MTFVNCSTRIMVCNFKFCAQLPRWNSLQSELMYLATTAGGRVCVFEYRPMSDVMHSRILRFFPSYSGHPIQALARMSFAYN